MTTPSAAVQRAVRVMRADFRPALSSSVLGAITTTRAGLSAALDVYEIANVLGAHIDYLTRDGRIICADCDTDLGPDDDTPAGWELHDQHIAQTIRTMVLGEAP